MRITRREFLKQCSIAAGALGLSASTIMKLDEALAKEAADGGVPTMWIEGAACTGCTMTLTNSIYYGSVADILIDTLDLDFHKTVMVAAGAKVDTGTGLKPFTGANALTAARNLYNKPPYVLVVEGAIQTAANGAYCEMGYLVDDTDETMSYIASQMAKKAVMILCVGQCACFGGIPAARGNQTGAMGMWDFAKVMALKEYPTDAAKRTAFMWAIRNKIVNVPGCPPHPDWIVGTIVDTLLLNSWPNINVTPEKPFAPSDNDTTIYKGWRLPTMDSARRPQLFFSQLHCFSCDRLDGQKTGKYQTGTLRQLANDKTSKCLKPVGCKGRVTKTDCPARWWNPRTAGERGVNYCVAAGYPCHGCTQPGFPDRQSPFIRLP